MHATLPLLKGTDFPAISRQKLETLQVNLGYLCNQTCVHCHVNAGPGRKEMMDRKMAGLLLEFIKSSSVKNLDLTGGAPEMNPHFREIVTEARKLGVKVTDRCNLTILEEPDYQDLAEFLAEQRVEVVASMPCYLEGNVNSQRGMGTFKASIRALRRLNALGYGCEDSGLVMNLVYNPLGPSLPPPQGVLRDTYKQELKSRYGIVFNDLFTITNMPIQRFGSTLISHGKFDEYMQLLRDAYKVENLDGLMCRSLISVDWQGYVYDCDFNQMLGLPLLMDGRPRQHLSKLINYSLEGNPIVVMDHCYGCTAGQGSSCGGALDSG
ncbi:MAG: arsenosugar biosynthesis radical SAM (seleno)protein ArsS [Mariprofundaceae bacterium]